MYPRNLWDCPKNGSPFSTIFPWFSHGKTHDFRTVKPMVFPKPPPASSLGPCAPGPGNFGLRSHVAGAGLEPGRRGEGSRAGQTQPDAERSGEWSDQIQYFLQIWGCFCRDLVWNGFLFNWSLDFVGCVGLEWIFTSFYNIPFEPPYIYFKEMVQVLKLWAKTAILLVLGGSLSVSLSLSCCNIYIYIHTYTITLYYMILDTVY